MQLSQMDLFRAARIKMAWLGDRQQVLAQNIANADTPHYSARDLKQLDFKRLIPENRSVIVSQTRAGHIQGTAERPEFRVEKENERDLYEMNPNSNAVVLEEQMMAVSGNQMQYQLVTNLYQKNLSMFKAAIGARQG